MSGRTKKNEIWILSSRSYNLVGESDNKALEGLMFRYVQIQCHLGAVFPTFFFFSSLSPATLPKEPF